MDEDENGGNPVPDEPELDEDGNPILTDGGGEGQEGGEEPEVEEEQEEEEEDGHGHGGGGGDNEALVGSISHILRTLFRDLYSNPRYPPGQEPPPPPPPPPEAPEEGENGEEVAAASREGSVQGSRPGSVEGAGGGEGGLEGEDEAAGVEEDGGGGGGGGGDDDAEDGAGEGGEGGEEEDDKEEEEEEEIEYEEEYDEEGNVIPYEPKFDEEGNEIPRKRKPKPEPEPEPEPEIVLNEHQKKAAALMVAIDERVEQQKAECARTMLMLRAAREAADKADKVEETRLKKQGILIGAHIPIGASHLSHALKEATLKMEESNRESGVVLDYPSLVPELISANALMEDNWRDYLYRSGRLSKPLGTGKRAQIPTDEPGYFRMTGSLENRKQLVLANSYGPKGMKSPHRKKQQAAKQTSPFGANEAALDDMLRSEIEADMDERNNTISFPEEGGGKGSPTTHDDDDDEDEDAKKKKKKKEEGVNGEQHDLDMKVLQRMEKRLQFTCNPRHDPRNKNNHRLLTLPPAGPEGATGLLAPAAPPPNGTMDVLAAWASRDKPPPAGDHGFFVADPEVVEFREYEVGGRYEASVLLRNVTTVARTLTVLPLATQFFSLAAIEYPSAVDGTLAPGMAVKATVRFEPDSLANYEDHMSVKTEGGAFPVRVWAHRDPPVLSIPLELDIGACLVGDAMSHTFVCTNSGGRGRFRLLTPEDYPEPSTAQRNLASLRMEPFNVAPTEFALGPGESVEINVDYVPLELGEHRASFVMVCDNCDITTYGIVARSESVAISVAQVNGGLDMSVEPLSGLKQLHFEPEPVGASESQTIVLKNSTSIDLPYHWDLRPAESSVIIGTTQRPNGNQEGDGSGGGGISTSSFEGFNISPRSGVMPALSDTPFDFSFAPQVPLPTGACVVLVVETVPPPSVPSGEQQELLDALLLHGHGKWLRMQAWFQALDGDGSGTLGPEELRDAMKALGLQSHKRAIREMMEKLDADGNGLVDIGEFMNNLPDEVAAAIELKLPRVPFKDIQAMIRCDVESIAMGVRGAGEHVLVAMDPPTFVVPGVAVAGDSYERVVTLTNLSRCTADFEFGAPLAASADAPGGAEPWAELDQDEAMRVEVQPAYGKLLEGGSVTLKVVVTPLRAGRHDVALPCCAAGGVEGGALFRIAAEVGGPRVKFQQPEVDLGLMAVGGRVDQTLTFTNEGSAACTWRMAAREPSADSESRAGNSKMSMAGASKTTGGGSKSSLASSSDATGAGDDGFKIDKARAEVTCSPSEGQLEPGEQATINVVCEAGKKPERVRATLECFVSGAADGDVGHADFDTQWISLRGEVQAPKVYLDTTEVNLGTTYIGVPVVRTVKLKNLSNLSTQYKWERPMGEATGFAFEFSPAQGALSEKQELEVTFTFNPKSSGVLNEFFCCHLYGMPKPVGFEMRTTVKGLVVAYETIEEGAEAPRPLGAPTDPQYFGEEPLPTADLPPKFNFGESIPLFERRQLRFVVRNLSAIACPFTIKPSRYRVQPPKPPLAGSAAASVKMAKGHGTGRHGRGQRRLLDNAHEPRSVFRSQDGRRHILGRIEKAEDHEMLSAGNGAAFSVTPASGLLEPWGVVEVNVAAFNEMPGEYLDDLECALEGAPMTRLGLKMKVEGCPLKLVDECVGVDAKTDPKRPKLRFGDVVSGSPDITKMVRIRNDGPIGALVSWTVKEPDDDDDGPQGPVELKLNVADFGKKMPLPEGEDPLNVSLKWREPKPYVPPYKVSPSRMLLKPHSDANFRVTLLAKSMAKAGEKVGSKIDAMMVLDAEWQQKGKGGKGGSSSTKDDASTVVSGTVGGGGRGGGGGTADTKSQLGGRDLGEHGTVGGKSTKSGKSGKSGKSKAGLEVGLERETLGAIKVQLGASMAAPFLMLDKQAHQDKGGSQFLKFVAHSTSLVPKGAKPKGAEKYVEYHPSQMRSVVLTNALGIPLTFAVASSDPFRIISTKCLAPPHPLGGSEGGDLKRKTMTQEGNREFHKGGIFSLPPSETLTLLMAFVPAKRPTTRKVGEIDLKSEDEGVLNINFSTGQLQQIKLRGIVQRPMVVCAPSEHDFGFVHTEKSSSFLLYVSNPTEVSAKWRIRHVPMIPPKISIIAQELEEVPKLPLDEPDMFSFDQYEGVQNGPSLPLSDAASVLPLDLNRSRAAVFKQTVTTVQWNEDTTLNANLKRRNDDNPKAPRPVKVTFRPGRNRSYQSRFRFEVAQGEGFDLLVSGRGTYEEDTKPNPQPIVGPRMYNDFISHRYEAGTGQDAGLKKAGGVDYVPSRSTRLAD